MDPQPDVEVGSFMGMMMEEKMIRNLATWTQKLAKARRENERRMSQYTCSTSDQTPSGITH